MSVACPSKNLPAPVARLGGAVAQILGNELNSYQDLSNPLSRRDQYAIARLVEDHPELNKEFLIGLLVDLISFHGQTANVQLRVLLDTHTLPVVAFALEYLYENGDKDRGHFGMRDLPLALIEDTCSCIDILMDTARLMLFDVDGLSDMIQVNGGIDSILDNGISTELPY